MGQEEVETFKVWDSLNKRAEFVSNSPRVKSPQDLVALEDAETKAAFQRDGVLGEDFRKLVEAMSVSEQMEVEIHLTMPRMAYLDKTRHSEEELRLHALAFYNRAPVERKEKVLARYGLREDPGSTSKVIRCRANKGQLLSMQRDAAIASVLRYVEPRPLAFQFSTLATSAYNPATGMPANARGQGINAATLEIGLSNTTQGSDGVTYPYGNFVGCLGNLNPANIVTIAPTNSGPLSKWSHSNATFKCLWQTATGANWFHHNNLSYSGSAAFIVTNAIRSASVSYANSFDYSCQDPSVNPTIRPFTANTLGLLEMDEMIFLEPYPVFSNPAANWGYQYEVNWQGYNGISVGNVQHANLHTYIMPANNYSTPVCTPSGGCSQTRNPKQRYGGASLLPANSVYAYASSDREMPYIVAPGYAPNAPEAMVDNCLEPSMLGGCGTSFSAPILNGIATSVLSADARMINWPEKVRAVLLATAQNVVNGEWNSAYDGRDGAGVVSGASAVAFARNHTEVYAGAPAAEHGIGASTLLYWDFYSVNGIYNIRIPNPKPSGKHLRIVLTWNSNPVMSPQDNRLSDLDLTFQGNPSRYSSSMNGNVEIIDVPRAEVTAGAAYAVSVNKYLNRIPEDEFTYYCIAWTWVLDHAY